MNAHIDTFARQGASQGASLENMRYSRFGRGARQGARFSSGLAGLGDEAGNLSSPITVNGTTYVLPGPVPEPNGWYVMSPYTQELYVADHGGISYAINDPNVVINPPPSMPPAPTPTPGRGSEPQSSARPSYDYVRAGDVIRISLPVGAGVYLVQGDVLSAIADGVRQSNMTYINGSTPGILGGGFTVDVQPGSDYAHLVDVASIVQSIAQGQGGFVSGGPASAAFVSKVENTKGQVKANAPPPPGQAPQISQGLLLGGAAIVGVVLLVVLKGK